jgi:NADP-dependent 3-hydroxy acid dehydrogenase YdfG
MAGERRGAAQPPVAIVTGASSGIGAATAECLAAAGFRVVLAARRGELLEEIARRIRAAGGTALGVATDLADEAATGKLVARTREAFGRVDVLVNNAGFSLAGAIEQLTRDELRRTFEVNLLAGLQLAGELIP